MPVVILMIVFIVTFIILLFLYKREIKKLDGLYKRTCNSLEKSYLSEKQDAILNLTKEKNDIIQNLQLMLEKESSLKVEMHKRVRELENGIMEGTGISLRNEVTKVDVPFNLSELNAMMNGLYFLIEKQYNKLEDVKYIVSLIEKIRNAIVNMQKEPDQKGSM